MTKNKKSINPVKAGLAGAAVIAAGAAAVALSKKENRKKAGKVLKNIKTKGENLSKKASNGLNKVLKEEKNLREKAQILRSKVTNGSVGKSAVKKSRAKSKGRSSQRGKVTASAS